jgi:hypothetical protein
VACPRWPAWSTRSTHSQPTLPATTRIPCSPAGPLARSRLTAGAASGPAISTRSPPTTTGCTTTAGDRKVATTSTVSRRRLTAVGVTATRSCAPVATSSLVSAPRSSRGSRSRRSWCRDQARTRRSPTPGMTSQVVRRHRLIRQRILHRSGERATRPAAPAYGDGLAHRPPHDRCPQDRVRHSAQGPVPHRCRRVDEYDPSSCDAAHRIASAGGAAPDGHPRC